MAKKQPKQPQKTPPKPQGISWKAVGGILGGITTLMGGVVTWLDFIVHAQSGYKIFLWAGIVFFITVWFIILWLLYKQRNYYGYIWLAVTVVAGVGVWYGWTSYVHAREEKLIVLIAEFDGPEDIYGLRNEIKINLDSAFENDDKVIIETVDEIITTNSDSGSFRARELSKKYQADLVIWGSYRPKENPNITIHIENLSPEELISIEESEVIRPKASLDDLEKSTFQQKAGEETKALLSYLAGVIEYLSNDYSSALARFDQALENSNTWKDPIFVNYAEMFFFRANSYIFLGDIQSSIQEYSKAIDIAPEFSSAYVNRGAIYLENQQYQQALDDLNKAIEIDPDIALAYVDRANTYYALGEVDRALDDYIRALQINPKFALAYTNRGSVYGSLGEYDAAVRDLESAIQIDPTYHLAYNNLGLVYQQLGDYQKSIDAFEQATLINPEYIEAYNNAGMSHMENGQYQSAIESFRMAIDMHPEFALAYFNMANAYVRLGDQKSAIQNYTYAIDLQPQNAKFINNRGVAYAMMEEYRLAIQDFDRVIFIEPHAMTYMNRGKSYLFLEEYQLAFQDLNQSLVLDPKYADAYYNRGLAYQKIGKNTEAEADFAKYKELTGQDVP